MEYVSQEHTEPPAGLLNGDVYNWMWGTYPYSRELFSAHIGTPFEEVPAPVGWLAYDKVGRIITFLRDGEKINAPQGLHIP